ncbi:LOW QUALITY PROTEIN: germin-like protein 9-3 [Eucalyptus grandis]|uniref:LOW QUALITY PROTEIN: germin-like protein 9-3 n=1 Tax=Eucalyptus grandis TaxID=71139 RepID=UPI00192EE986|nr:LOW QUALITY PROTEIN: germin-like protein 9-3 [Eucalyptus grandis]
MANYELVVALVLSLSLFRLTSAGDPDILTDFVAPNGTNVDGNFFTYTGMRSLMGFNPPTTFTVTKASLKEFPALDGQSVSFAVLEFPPGSVNPPHTHPRGSELLFLIYGSLEVGFVDTTNKLFTQTLQTGDMFIFPKGLVHYQYIFNQTDFAVAVSAFGSASAGTVSVPVTVFGTNIDDGILAKSFNTNVSTIQALKAGLTPPPTKA